MNRLLWADLRKMWRQGFAISMLLACGIALFVMTNSSMVSLERSRDRYYRDYRFADVFATLTRAPQRIADRIGELPGVANVQTRVVRSAIVDIPGMSEPASCQLVSIDVQDPSPLNEVYLTRGLFPEQRGRSEVVVSQRFAEANGFEPGDQLECILGGRKETLHIVGIGSSPEHVYVVQPGLIATDDRRFGVLWMPRTQMEAAYNMEGAFNDLAVQLRPRTHSQDVIDEVDRLLSRYGGTGAYDREEQASHQRVSDEMTQMKTMAFVTPSIFLAVSGFLFNIVFTRLIRQQTEQIASLRAFGYRPSEVAWHYIKLVMVWVVIAAVMGWMIGYRMSWWMTAQYGRFFHFPNTLHEFAFAHGFFAILAGVLAAAAGTFLAIRRAFALQPAVAMRPPAPPDFQRLWMERLGIARWFSPIGRMVLRRLETNPLATGLSVLGMAMGVAVLVLGSFMEDAIDFVIRLQFDKTQRQDITLTFNESLAQDCLADVLHLPGVSSAEPFRAVPVRLTHGVQTKRVGLMGLPASPRLSRILDDQSQSVRLPGSGGLVISEKMAEVLDVSVDGTLFLETLDRSRIHCEVRVVKVFPNFTEPVAYIELNALHRLIGESPQYSGAFVTADLTQLDDFYDEVKQIPTIASVLDKHAALATFQELISESTGLMRVVNAIFSIAIAIGVIYNCAVIILAERARDLATLRVMGFRRREVSLVLLGELAVITLLSLPVGVPIGYAFSYFVTRALDTETHRFPLVVQSSTYAYAATVIIITAALAALYVRRMLDDLDLVAVLKVKE